MNPIRKEQVLLASTAPWRSEILTRQQIPHRALPPRFTEPPFEQGNLEDHVQQMAQAKAASLESDFPNALILGADQLCTLDHDVFGKPKDASEAFAQLTRLQGRTHRLVNGLCVIYKGRKLIRLDEAFLTMRNLTHSQIEHYIAKDQPLGCCGSYKIESLGASLFTEVRARDPHSVAGMPVSLLIDMLGDLGFTNLA